SDAATQTRDERQRTSDQRPERGGGLAGGRRATHRSSMPAPPRVDWRFAVAATLLLTCLFTIESMGWSGAPPFGVIHRHQMISWGIWLALTPAIIAAARRHPFGEGSRGRWLGRHLVWGLLFSGVAMGITTLLRTLLGAWARDALAAVSVASFLPTLAGDLLRYSVIALS